DVARIEPRRGQREPQIVERLIAILRQRAKRALNVVAVGAEGELDRLAIEPFVEGFGIKLAGALIEQRSDEVADTGFLRWILVGAASEREADRDERNRRLV